MMDRNKTIINVPKNKLTQTILIYSVLPVFHSSVALGQSWVWQICLDKLYSLDKAVALQACIDRLRTGDVAPIHYLLQQTKDLTFYHNSLMRLIDRAGESQAIKEYIETVVSGELQKQFPERMAIAIASLVRLQPLTLLDLCNPKNPYQVIAWRIALAKYPDLLSMFLGIRLRKHKAPHWGNICELMSQLAMKPDEVASLSEKRGNIQARTILAKAITLDNETVRKETACILAQTAPDNNFELLADILVEQLNGNLLDLLVDDQPAVRKMIYKTLHELLGRFPRQFDNEISKAYELSNRIVELVSLVFRSGHDDAVAEALDTLSTLNPHLITREAEWAVQQGNEERVKALLNLTENTPFVAVIRGIYEGCHNNSQSKTSPSLRPPSSQCSTIIDSLINCYGMGVLKNSFIVIPVLISLRPSALLSLHANQLLDQKLDWRIALVKTRNPVSEYLYRSLLKNTLQYWDDICNLAFRIADESDSQSSSIEKDGAHQMREILATIIISKATLEVRQKMARILAKAAPAKGPEVLLNKISIRHLERLEEFLNDAWSEVRLMVRRVLHAILDGHYEHSEKITLDQRATSLERITAMFSRTFRAGENDATAEALLDLVKLNPLNARNEAKWAVKNGREYHIKSLLKLNYQDGSYKAAIQGLRDSCPLDNDRSDTVWSWVLAYDQAESIECCAISLNALADINKDKTKESLRNNLHKWSDEVFHLALTDESSVLLDILWELVEESANIRPAILEMLVRVVKIDGLIHQPEWTVLRTRIIDCFYKGLQNLDNDIWKPCLYKLIDPLIGLLQLAKNKKRIPKHIFPEVVEFATNIALQKPVSETAIAMIALAYLSPNTLPQIYMKRRKHKITKVLIDFAKSNDKTRLDIINTLCVAFHLNPKVLDDKLIKGEQSLEDWLFPFNLDPTAENEPVHLEELVNEPDGNVNGRHTTIWIYQQPDSPISQLILAGQTNSAICKRVSATILTTYLKDMDETVGTILIPGAFQIETTPNLNNFLPTNFLQFLRQTKKNQQQLAQLIDELEDRKQKTGLLDLHHCAINNKDFLDEFCNLIKKAKDLSSPLYVRPGLNELTGASFLPFFLVNENGGELETLSFDLDIGLFSEGDQIVDIHIGEVVYQLGRIGTVLHEAHSLELQHEIIADAEQRKKDYLAWRVRDESTLKDNIRQMFRRMFEDHELSRNDLPQWIEEYYQKELRPRLALSVNPLPNWTIDLPDHRTLNELKELGYEYIREHVETRQLDLGIESNLSRDNWLDWTDSIKERSDSLQEFIQRKRPQLIDDSWNRRLDLIQRRDIETQVIERRMRDRIELVTERSGYTSIQEAVEWDSLDFIREDDDWIRRMDEYIKFGEASEENTKLQTVNLQMLLEAFLRGQMPVFLPDTEVKQEYKDWCSESRKNVWNEIHRILKDRDISLEPLQQNNVVFNIHLMGNNRIRVTPYYLANNNEFAVLVHPRFGITYYVNEWQHREIRSSQVQDRGLTCEELCEAGANALLRENVPEALSYFRQALRVHPEVAAKQIFVRFLENTIRNTNAYVDDMMLLIKARDEILNENNYEQALDNLEIFIEEYPNFLPDPYLLLGYYQKLQQQYLPLRAEVTTLIDTYYERQKEINRLVPQERLLVDTIKNLIKSKTENLQQQEILGNQYNEFIRRFENLAKLETAYNQKLKTIRDSGILVFNYTPEVIELKLLNEQIKEEINRLEQFDPIEQQMAQFSGIKQQIENFNAELDILDREINQINLDLDELRNQFDQGIAELNDREQHLKELKVELKQIRDAVLEEICAPELNVYVQAAMNIDAEYVRMVQTDKLLRASDWFNRHLAPLYNIYLGNEYLQILLGLDYVLDNLQDFEGRSHEERQTILNEIYQVISENLYPVNLSPEQLTGLRNLFTSFEDIRGQIATNTIGLQASDPIQKVRYDIRTLIEEYSDYAFSLYSSIANLPETSEVRFNLSYCLHRQTHYNLALQYVKDLLQVPLFGGFPQAVFEILDHTPREINKIRVIDNGHAQIIQIKSQEEWVSIVELQRLNTADRHHIAEEVMKEEFLEEVKKTKNTGLSSAYAILFTPIRVPQQTQLWTEILNRLEGWLIQAQAQTGTSPIPFDQNVDEEVMDVEDNSDVIEEVTVNSKEIYERLLNKYNLKDNVQYLSNRELLGKVNS